MKICEESVRAALEPVVGQESLSPWDKQRILRAAQSANRRTRTRPLRRLLSVCAVAVLCLACATGVLAAMPEYARKLNMLSQEALSFLQPVEEVCEAAGLRMEVIAATNDGRSVVIYIGLTDLTGQDRLDETVSLPDIRLTGMGYVSCENVHKREDGTLILRLRGVARPDEQLDGRKVTLAIGDVLLQNIDTGFVDTGLTVAQVVAENPKPALETTARKAERYEVSGSTSGRLYQLLDTGSLSSLKAGAAQTLRGLEWAAVRGIGVVDGVLHILLEPDAWYNDVSFLLADSGGPRYDLDTACVYLGLDALHEALFHQERYEREEQLLALPEAADLEALHIGYYASTYEEAVAGPWETTFVVQGMTDTIQASCALDMQPWVLTQVTVSPVGVTLEGSGVIREDSLMPDVELVLRDGAVCTSGSINASVTTVYSGEADNSERVECTDFFAEPLDLEEVQAVTVCGEEIWRRAA